MEAIVGTWFQFYLQSVFYISSFFVWICQKFREFEQYIKNTVYDELLPMTQGGDLFLVDGVSFFSLFFFFSMVKFPKIWDGISSVGAFMTFNIHPFLGVIGSDI